MSYVRPVVPRDAYRTVQSRGMGKVQGKEKLSGTIVDIGKGTKDRLAMRDIEYTDWACQHI